MSSGLSRLLDWLKSVGIWWDESLVEIRAECSGCSGPALGVFALQDLKENQLLCMIPRTTILSPCTTQLARILEQEKLGGGLALTIAVMYEASLGAASKWAGYFASLPSREYLPMFWTDEELSLLAGTALEGKSQEDRCDIEDDYTQHVKPLLAKHKEAFPHPELCELQHFCIAASWVASRSFHVDSWHGDAMVPLADIFNHKASIVLLGDNWKVAEELTRQQQQKHQHGADSSNDTGSDCSSDMDGGGSEEPSHDNSETESEGSDEQDEQSGDPQYGFALGGMPMIAPDNVDKCTDTGAVHSWVRDGLNLRLEIGICSIGEPDSNLQAAAAATSAAAPAAAISRSVDDQQQHTQNGSCQHAGCTGWEAHDEQQEGHQRKRQRTVEAHGKQQGQQQQQHVKQQGPQQQHQGIFPGKRLEIIAASPVKSGAEVHNTYGELSNEELVHKYGFCLPQNPFDEVQLGPSWQWLLCDLLDKKQQQQVSQHCKWLEEHCNLSLQPKDSAGPCESDGGSGSEADQDGSEEPFEPPAALAGARLHSTTAAILRLLGQPPEQLETYNSLDELLQIAQVPPAAAAAGQQNSGIKMQQADADKSATGVPQQAAVDGICKHLDGMLVTQHDVMWWGRAGLELLAAAVQQRLQQYTAGGRSLLQDEKTLQHCQEQQHHQQHQQQSDIEHITATAAALQLRVCEQHLLHQLHEAIQQVLEG